MSNDKLTKRDEAPYVARRRVIASEILALNTSPVEIVATPEDDEILVPLFMILIFHPGSTPYTNINQGLYLAWPPGRTVGGPNGTSLLDQAVKTISFSSAGEDLPGSQWATEYAGQPLVLKTNESDPTAGGGGVLDVVLTYMKINISEL